jgi:hypothetical protein
LVEQVAPVPLAHYLLVLVLLPVVPRALVLALPLQLVALALLSLPPLVAPALLSLPQLVAQALLPHPPPALPLRLVSLQLSPQHQSLAALLLRLSSWSKSSSNK